MRASATCARTLKPYYTQTYQSASNLGCGPRSAPSAPLSHETPLCVLQLQAVRPGPRTAEKFYCNMIKISANSLWVDKLASKE